MMMMMRFGKLGGNELLDARSKNIINCSLKLI